MEMTYPEPDGGDSGRSQLAWTAGDDGVHLTNSVGKGSFMDQLKALLIRNLTLKMRDKRKTLTEFLMPLYWIMILAIIRMSIKDEHYDPVGVPHGQAPLLRSLPTLNASHLHVVPANNTEVETLVEKIQELGTGMGVVISVVYHNSEEDLLKAFRAKSPIISRAVVFPHHPVMNKTYLLRFNPLSILTGGLPLSSNLWSSGPNCRSLHNEDTGLQLSGCPPNHYFFSGFSVLQTLIDTAIISLQTKKNISVPSVTLENFPKEEYQSGGGLVLRSIVPLYMVFAWAQFIVYMLMLVVEEKEKKIKESMKMMGLRDSVYWLSWFAVYGAYVLVLALICIVVLPLSGVFKHVNLLLLFILFILYGCSSIVFAFMMTPFFNRAKVAGLIGNLTQVAFSLLFYLQVYLGDSINQGVFWALALLSPCAFSFAVDKVIMFDVPGGGLGFNNVWEGPGLPFAGSLIMLSVDILLYLFLAYYLDSVIPSTYGTKRKPWFLCTKSFWTQSNKSFQFASLCALENGAYENDDNLNNPNLEPVSPNMSGRAAVSIRNLTKIFHPPRKEPVTAVDNFSLDIYESQITAILGHNGAGKTTLFNILTGMTAATKGSAKIFGMDVNDANELTEIRRITGVCPQHDVVFQTLTPREHLRFFARIRGIQSEQLDAEVEQTLKDVGLNSKGDTVAADLSGGQKRKLSIGIALIGDPRIIFLDEPTAGVDAYSRRLLWSLLKKKKEGKVILLTTHFMDEADILADRKAIMSHGRLQCCGSSLFLKNKFGVGYHLTLVVGEDVDANRVTEALQEVVPQVQMARFYGKEMSFILPSDSAREFSNLFMKLDRHITGPEENIGIEGYGISMTTLEEVFLALSEEDHDNRHSVDNLAHQMIRDKSSSSSPLHSASLSIKQEDGDRTNKNDTQGFAVNAVDVMQDSWRAFKALVKFRFLGVSREIGAVFFLVVLPLAFVAGSIALANGQKIQLPTDELLPLVPKIYGTKPAGALLHNGSDDNLTLLESTFESVNMAVDDYTGNYSDLRQPEAHMTALNVANFSTGTANPEQVNLRLLFNDTYAHSIPIVINLISNAILRSFGEKDMINTSSQSLPAVRGALKFDATTFTSPMMIGLTFTIISAGLGIECVYDREIMARSILRLNGVGFNSYFMSYFVVLGAIYMVSYLGLLIVIAAFQVPSLIIPQAFAAIAILYLLYIPCSLLYSVVFCYIFDKSETARQFYPNMCTTVGMVAYTIVSLVDILVVGIDKDNKSSLIVHTVFTVVLPNYIPFGLMYFINKVYIDCSVKGNCGDLTFDNYFTPEIIVLFVVVLVDIPFYYILLRIADTLKFGGSWREALWMKESKVGTVNEINEQGIDTPAGEDDDVKEERTNVAAAMRDGDRSSPVLIYDLGKVFNKGTAEQRNNCKKKKAEAEFVALKSVSLKVKAGEVFGLLGPNGAGKTTCLRVMTAEEKPTKGKVQICGEDVSSSISSAFAAMGYCPQHDALWRNLTVAEHIEVFAEIRGVHKDQVKPLIDTYLQGLEIEEHRKKMVKACSGGTKRKLSYILSMLGCPQVVLLDEPSTGMDPQSKRFLWNSILASFKGDRSAILTTHSMEEADALCSRIGILVKGGMRCVGAIQHLKNKYGGGYTVEMKLKCDATNVEEVNSPSSGSSVELMNDVTAMLKEVFPRGVLDEQFGERFIYKVPQDDISSLSKCFEMLEKAKADGLVEEYALSQTTLEQVFLKFARQQEFEDDDEEVSTPQTSLSTTHL